MKLIADKEKLNVDRCAYVVSEKLKNILEKDNSLLYYNFPLYRGEIPEDLIKAQLMLVSPVYGVLFFMCRSEYITLTDKEAEYMENMYSNIWDRLNKTPKLRKNRRELKILITPVVAICSAKDVFVEGDNVIASISNFDKLLKTVATDSLDDEEYRYLCACIEGTRTLTPKKERTPEPEQNKSKSAILNLIQNQEAVFDIEQKRIALVTIEGPQRIRGLAGSGKTIVLTMKAAIYHLQYPDEEIVYTYYTKSLYGMIHSLIERYYRNFSDNREPNWNKIHILHGWGGEGLHGVYYQACMDNSIRPLRYKETLGHDKNPFVYVCEDILKHNIQPKYDLTLIDEGQDFPKEFYRLCYHLSKNKKIVWAYDDFQNIFDVKIQDERGMFGKDSEGHYLVDFSKINNPYKDIVLHTCYRNPRNVVIYAFALGLGIYNDIVVQRLADDEQWRSLGFIIEKGNSEEGSEMVISRPPENSPSYLSPEYGYTVQIKVCDSLKKECETVASMIENDIHQEGLRSDDICVICLDDKNIGQYYTYLSEILLNKGIRSYNHISAPYSNIQFIHEGYVTLATLNKAKGNEAGMVYVMGADRVFNYKDNVIQRNRLFTAITRTKGWCVITGERSTEQGVKEMKALKEHDLKLVFIQPSEDNAKTIENVSQERLADIESLQRLWGKLEGSGLSKEEILKYVKSNDSK